MAMPDIDQTDCTRVLADAAAGDPAAEASIWELVYDELHRIAHREMASERTDATLSTTALIHEAWFKLVDQERIARRERGHFYALACRAMRQVLIEHARGRNARKRQGGWRRVTLEDEAGAVESRADDLLALDEALTRLAAFNPRLGRVVELRFYAGLTNEEAAEILEVDVRTVERDWRRAKAYLQRMLEVEGSQGPTT